jgi:putative transposase
MNEVITSLSGQVSVTLACRAMGISRATLYRSGEERVVSLDVLPAPRPSPPRTLTQAEREKALSVLHSERFVDTSPGEVVATLLDEGRYVCSERTLYRILNEHDEVKERRNQARHGAYAKPELLATQPNEVWSWDITKVKGPGRGAYYNLYVVLDIFSRYVVGWRLEHTESDKMAEYLLRTCCLREGVGPGDLTVHADRGPSMRSKAVSDLLYDLGVAKSHSRPYTSDDNPYSESAFRTLKYRPEMPARTGDPRGAAVVPGAVRLVQPVPPSQRDRDADAGDGARGAGRGGFGRSPDGSRCGVYAAPRAICKRKADGGVTAAERVDQPTASVTGGASGSAKRHRSIRRASR